MHHSTIIFTVTNDLAYDRRMQRICASLQKNGWDVTLIGRQLPNSPALTNLPFKTQRIRCYFNKGKLFYIEYNFRLFWKLLFMKADVYGAVDLDTIIPVFKVAILKGKKKVFDAHEYFQEVPEVTGRPVTKFIWSTVAKIFIPRADVAITVSESLAKEFEQLYGKSFHVIRNVPEKKQPIETTASGKYLLYQGALNEGRGLEHLIEAMQKIDMPLKIAGEGDLSENLRQQAKALGMEDKVEFLGFISPEKLNPLTAQAWLGFNLLENKSLSYYYSLANKFFDYIQHGVPSVNMDFPEYRALNAQYRVAILLDQLSVEDIITVVNKLKNDSESYKQLRQNCLCARNELNWENEEEKLKKIFSSLILF